MLSWLYHGATNDIYVPTKLQPPSPLGCTQHVRRTNKENHSYPVVSPFLFCLEGIINIENVKVNPYQSSIFTCYLTDNLQADQTTVQFFKYANGHRNNSTISRNASALTSTHVFKVDNVAPGDQYLCMLEKGVYFANLTVTARTYGKMFDKPQSPNKSTTKTSWEWMVNEFQSCSLYRPIHFQERHIASSAIRRELPRTCQKTSISNYTCTALVQEQVYTLLGRCIICCYALGSSPPPPVWWAKR